MMNDEITKQKLIQLKRQLEVIENDFYNLNTELENLKNTIKKKLIVDNSIIDEDIYDKIVKKTDDGAQNIKSAKSIIQNKI